jgi:hypothetical protein
MGRLTGELWLERENTSGGRTSWMKLTGGSAPD